MLMKMGHVACVTNVGIAAWFISRSDKSAVGDYNPIRSCPVGSVLYITHLTDRDVIKIHHLPADMGQGGLFFNQISTTGNTMLQWDTFNCDTSILIDRLPTIGINRIKYDVKSQVMRKETNLSIQFWLQCLWGMDMKTSRATQKSKGRNHTDEAETMVTMKVSDKDVTEFRKTHTTLSQLHLGSLSTVKHQHLIAQLNHL